MPELTNDQLLGLVDSTFSWGDNISEKWTGTAHAEYIDKQKNLIKDSIRMNDLDRVRVLLFDLAQFLDRSEREYEGVS